MLRDTNEYKYLLCSCFGRINSVQLSILKLSIASTPFPSKSQWCFYLNRKKNSSIHSEPQRP